MTQYLAYADFMSDENTSFETLFTLPVDSEIGCKLEVDLKYPF